ncbi:monovalent cation:proton antiporter-2 (CPA2) family protein [Sandaracinobacter sp.]|jgi:monovalent cation:proton antiporter-2 (CPA2) family protein|uniref:monovalent cation:proton antiporter-2 (CPA2) family protein n=1 Tax=Sandaracinobacter sp. TaxID=2487581 RepID=UPI0035AE545B
MAGIADTTILREAVIFLGAAAVMVPLFSRFKLGAVLGYLTAGLLIGPYGFGLIDDTEDVLAFGEYGIVLLLFVIGLELQPARLWALRRDIFGLGTAQVVLTGLALAATLLLLTALTWQSALVVGLALALSSTALVVQYLQEKGQLNTREGERIFSILLLQDLAIVPLLIIVSALSRAPNPDAPEGLTLVAASVGTIVALVLAGRYVLNPAMRLFGQVGTRDIFVIAALLTVLGASYLMASFGLSMALGAFIAGVMLADSPYRHELEADIEPFRGLLLGLFFLAVGMTLDIAVVLRSPGQVLMLVAALVLVKTAVITVLARAFGTPWDKALPMGLLLSEGGEFAFVLLASAVAGLLIRPDAASLFTAVVTLSMLCSLLLSTLYRRYAAARAQPADDGELDGPEPGSPGSVIVIGYGRFGQIVTQLLHARGLDVVLIDTKPDQIEQSRRFGWKVYYGDGFRPDVLRAAGARDARLLIVTSGGAWEPQRLDAVRKAFPHLRILVRAHDRVHYMRLVAADIDLAVRELFHSAIEVGRLALREVGTAEDTIDSITAEYVRREQERLALQVASGDIMAGRDTIFRPGTGWKPDAPDTSLGEIPPVELDAR